MTRRFKTLCAATLTGLAAILPPGAWADAVLHARVSYDAGGSMIRGAEDSDWSHATVNTLLLPGDTLWVDQGGTSELEFSGGHFLRMADGSKGEISVVAPSPTVRGWEGSFYVHRLARSTGDFVFVTPSATVQVEPDSAVRVDIVNEATTVTVRWGRAAVRADVGSPAYVSSGERLWVDPGLLPSNPTPFDRNQEDGFDVWNRERAELLATGYSNVPEAAITEPVMGVSDLGNYGEWVYVDNTRYWRPTVVTNYVPYRYGSWSHTPSIGYTWVDHYPFSYVTTHYGRWRYMPTYGWCWGYDPVWSPAWVATVRCGDYLVWSPVDYYYRPAYTSSSAFFTIGGVSFGMFASSYCPVSYVGLGPRYVYGMNHDISDYIYGHSNDVYIWNININDSRGPHVRVPYERPLDQVRIFNPRRSIRGPQSLGGDSVLASQRVSRLESSIGRAAFRDSGRSTREVRTDAASPDRAARVRSVRVSQEAPSYTRASARNPEDAVLSANRTERVPRSRDIGTGEDVGGRRSPRNDATTPERGAAARENVEGRSPIERGVRESGAERPSDAASRTPAGTDARKPRGERGEATTERTPSTGGNSRGIRPGTLDRGGENIDSRTATPENLRGNLRGPSVRVSPEASRTQIERGNSDSNRSPVRSGPPAVTTPERERVTTPTTRGNSSGSSTRVERTPSRSGPPPASAPDRSLSSETERRPRVITTTPSQTPANRGGASGTVQRTRPVEVPAQRSNTRVVERTTVRESAPQVEVPSSRAPEPSRSRSYSTPQISRPSAPEPSRQPSRSITRSEPSAPRMQEAPAPRVERSAPQQRIERAPAPEISRPTPRMPEVSRPADSGRRSDDSSRGGGEGRSVRGR